MTSPISKTRIDQLGDRLKEGATTDADLRLLDSFRRSFVPAYENVINTVKDVLSVEVTGRPAKSTTSIIEKLRRESIRLTQIQDIAGCRFVVADIQTQNRALERLVAALAAATIVDRREHPSHGYRAVHIVAVVQGRPIEIQVRTTLQHLWAEFSEKAADIFDPGIKYGIGPAELLRLLAGFSEIGADVEADELVSQETERDPQLGQLKKNLLTSLERLIEGTAAIRKKRKE